MRASSASTAPAAADLARIRGRAVEIGALDAAVAEVLLFFSVDVGITMHALERHAQLVGDELADLRVHALPHLRRAGRDLHAAVEVDVHQRVGLVEELRVERDPELHGRQSTAP